MCASLAPFKGSLARGTLIRRSAPSSGDGRMSAALPSFQIQISRGKIAFAGTQLLWRFAEKPSRTKTLRWMPQSEAATLLLVSENLRPVLLKAFDAFLSQASR